MELALSGLIAGPAREPAPAGLLAVNDRSTPLAGIACLFVDDGVGAATDAAVLRSAGATVSQARTIREGLLLLAERSWDLVLVDETLVDGSGYKVVAYALAGGCPAILILADAAGRSPSFKPSGPVLTFLERDHSSERLLDSALTTLRRIRRTQRPSLPTEATPCSKAFSLADFSAQRRLTRRQSQVLSMLVAGLSAKEIATEFCVSGVTIRRHAEDIYRKCGVRCQRQLLSEIARMTGVLGE